MDSMWKDINGTWFKPSDVSVIHAPEYNKYDERWTTSAHLVMSGARQTSINFESKDEAEIIAIHAKLVDVVVN
jgi:hypothetical protein